MLGTHASKPLRRVVRHASSRNLSPPTRAFASVSNVNPVDTPAKDHKVVVVGGGAAGLSIGHQLLRSGQFNREDIAIVDPAQWHDYQPGWTLVGGGLKDKKDLRRPMKSLIDPKIKFYQDGVTGFSPGQNAVFLNGGRKVNYNHLVVVPGISLYLDAIPGLRPALDDPNSPVSSIYSYDYCDKASRNIQAFKSGKALFTQPAGTVKCAGAPQKIMWLALDHWRRQGYYNVNQHSQSPIQITFATGIGAMFGVPKYSKRLNALREQRGVEGLFLHDLVSIDGNKATFNLPEGKGQMSRHFDFLHAVPKMGPHDFIKKSPLANEAGFVDVDINTTRHKNYPNIWSAGDAAGLPTSKTAAAVTAQAPVLVKNLLHAMKHEEVDAKYYGYTSCPLLTSYGKVMLAEFKYDAVPEETFGRWVDQGKPRRAFYHLKKDFFPWVYFKSMLKGTWGGREGWLRT